MQIMLSALKLGWKHQRQRQAQKNWEKHTTFIPVGFMATPPLSSFSYTFKTWYPLPLNFRKSPFKMRETTPTRIWRIPPHFLFPHFFSYSFFFPLLSPLPFSHFFVCLFLSLLHLNTFSPENFPYLSRTSPASYTLLYSRGRKVVTFIPWLNHQESKWT